MLYFVVDGVDEIAIFVVHCLIVNLLQFFIRDDDGWVICVPICAIHDVSQIGNQRPAPTKSTSETQISLVDPEFEDNSTLPSTLDRNELVDARATKSVQTFE